MIQFSTNFQIWTLRIINWVFSPILWPIFQLPVLKPISIKSQIDKLERIGEIEKARILRKDWLKKLPHKYTAALWRSEGDDLLYKQEKYEESLAAYKNSMSALELSPSNVGVTDPLRLYFGAAVSAVMVGEIDNAEKYLNEFLPIYNSFIQDKKVKEYASNFTSGLQWLRENIYSDGKRCHLKPVANPSIKAERF